MKPFKKILVPLDFSSHSSEAIKMAVDLARRYEGSITLVYVYEPVVNTVPDGYLFYMPGQLEKLLAEYKKALEAAKRETESAGGKQVETHQLEGNPASEIVELARKGGFDLIVMGTHGRTGVQHALLGSVAERVLRKAACPVLTVKAPQSH